MTIIDLSDAKQQLNITSTASDGELGLYVSAASAVAEYYCGDLDAGRTYTEVHDGGDAAIYLRHTPVATITSITEYIGNITYTLTSQPPGSSVDAWGYSLDDPASGRVVRRTASGQAFRYAPGFGNVVATYTTGGAVLETAMLAAMMIVQHLWQTQRGAQPLPLQPGENESLVPGINYGIPNDAITLLQTAGRNPVIA